MNSKFFLQLVAFYAMGVLTCFIMIWMSYIIDYLFRDVWIVADNAEFFKSTFIGGILFGAFYFILFLLYHHNKNEHKKV